MAEKSYSKEIISSFIILLWLLVWSYLVNIGIVPRSVTMLIVTVPIALLSLYISLNFFRRKKKLNLSGFIQGLCITFLVSGLSLYIFLSSTFKIP